MNIILMGIKKGMTRVFSDKGEAIPVSVIEIKPATVLTKKASHKEGEEILTMGYSDVKEQKLKKPVRGFFKKIGMAPKKFIRENSVSLKDAEALNPGDQIDLTCLKQGDYVDVAATSIGKGFAGVIKRYNFSGGRKTHGSHFHRSMGSIGASASPARVYKGRKMPGRMGGERVTVQSLLVVDVRKDDNVIVLRGAIPGHKGSIVQVTKAKKKQTK